MLKRQDDVCPVCGLEVCKTIDDCYVDHLAQREQDHKDWVADMEENRVEAAIACSIAADIGKQVEAATGKMDLSKLTDEQALDLEDRVVDHLMERLRGK